LTGWVGIGYNPPPLHDTEASLEALIGQQKKVKKEFDTQG